MPTRVFKRKLQEKYTKWAIVTLVVFGVLGITARLLFSEQIKLPYGDSAWTVAIEAKIPNAEKNDRISVSPPWNLAQIRLVSQHLQYTDMRIIRTKNGDAIKRDIELKVEKPGNLTFYAEFNVHLSNLKQNDFTRPTPPLTTERRALFLAPEEKLDPTSFEVTKRLRRLSAVSTDNADLIQRIFKYAHKNIVKDIDNINTSADVSLRTNKAATVGRSRAMVALSRAAGIPARIVTGFILTEELDAPPYYWVELYSDDDSQWVPYDPEKGYFKELPANFLAFNRGSSGIIKSKNIDDIQIIYTIEQNYDLAGLNIIKEQRIGDIFDLERFPPNTRYNISLLLLLPFGVLITTLLRNIVGIRGYGTFTPTLLALAAAYADWIAGLVLLIIVVAFSLSGRSAMPDKLTRITRLAIMFTIVIMSMVIGVSLMDYFKVSSGEAVILLPIVILTSLIDSFYKAVEDSGATIAIRRMMWTVIISALCYPILKLETLGNLLLTYPESHFITLSLILTISLYSGKKVSEYPLFNWIKEPENTKATNKKAQESTEL